MTIARRRLANGYDAWCDPVTGEVILAEGLTAEQETSALRQVCARLLGDLSGAPDALPLTRAQAVRPQLHVVRDLFSEDDDAEVAG